MTDELQANTAMTRYAAGDDAVFSKIYSEVAPGLYTYLRHHTRSDDLARDLLQQTFLHVHRGRDTFVPGAEAGAWIVAIARRVLIDSKRREKRLHVDLWSERTEAGCETAEEQLRARELARRMERTLRRIPLSQRVAFELVRGYGLSLFQAARTLGTTEAAVKQRTHRAALALRKALDSA